MSVIVAVVDAHGGLWMGGDAACVDAASHDRMRLRAPELFRAVAPLRGSGGTRACDVLLGVAGSPRIGQVLRYDLALPTISESESPESYLTRSFVPAVRSALAEHGVLKTEGGSDRLDGSVLLVGLRGRLFEVDNDLSWTESAEPFAAIGAGAAYVKGYLAATDWRMAKGVPTPWGVLRGALAVAERFNAACGEPFTVLAEHDVVQCECRAGDPLLGEAAFEAHALARRFWEEENPGFQLEDVRARQLPAGA